MSETSRQAGVVESDGDEFSSGVIAISEPPIVPTSFLEITRALHLLHARTIPGRLDDFGIEVLEDLVGGRPKGDEAKAWWLFLLGRLDALREAGDEPALPPSIPSTARGIDTVIRWLDRVATRPQGIENATTRKRLFHALGGVFPAPSTAAVWRDTLREEREEILERAREQEAQRPQSSGSRKKKKRGAKPKRPKTVEVVTLRRRPSRIGAGRGSSD